MSECLRGSPATPVQTLTRFCLGILAAVLSLLPAAYAAYSRMAGHNTVNSVSLPREFTTGAELQWMFDLASWTEATDVGASPAREQQPGYFPLGNGRLFVGEGGDRPLNAIRGLWEPRVSRPWIAGQICPLLTGSGMRPLPWDRQKVAWPREAGVVFSESTADDATLRTWDFLHPRLPILFRLCDLDRGPRTSRRSLSLGLAFRGMTAVPGAETLMRAGDLRLRAGVWGGHAIWLPESELAPAGPGGAQWARDSEARRPALLVPFGRAHGTKTHQSTLFYLTVADSEAEERDLLAAVHDTQSALDPIEECQAEWSRWHRDGIALDCTDQRVADLITIQQSLIKAHQDARGALWQRDHSPYTSAREAVGPTRFMLRAGHTEEVKRALDFYYQACAAGAIRAKFGPDAALAPAAAAPNWRQLPVEEPGAAAPLILEHYWYWLYTGDLETVAAHYDLLRAALLGQKFDSQYRLPFHGDESYRFRSADFYRLEPDQLPDDYVSLDLLSADSAFEFVAAGAALARLARALGKRQDAERFRSLAARVRRATESLYWQADHGFFAPAMSRFSGELHQYPFANINLDPLWLGYWTPDDKGARNVLNALRWLWRENGTARATPTFGYATGMTPGMVLRNLAALDHAAAERALQGVLNAADRAGNFPEVLCPDGTALGRPGKQPIARLWEGGINAEAILYYLTGLEPDAPHDRLRLCPRLPSSWEHLDVAKMKVGGHDVALSVRSAEELTSYTITSAVPRELRCRLIVSLPDCELKAVGVNQGERLRPLEKLGLTRSYGRVRFALELLLHQDKPVQVRVQHTKPAAASTRLPTAQGPFPYRPPRVGAADTLLLTGSKQTAAAYRAQLGARLCVMDTNIAFPPSYLRAALKAPALRKVLLDVEHYPGAFKTPRYWTKGEGGRALRDFQARGGIIERVGNPSSRSGAEEGRK